MNNTPTKKKIYVLNISVNEYDLKELNQIGDMYGSFLGDLNAVNSHVYKLQKDVDVASQVDFILIPIYLHYFSNGDNFKGTRNKELIFNRLDLIEKEFNCNQCEEKIFVFFLHAHGASCGASNEDSCVFVDNSSNQDENTISKSEIYKKICPLLKYADCYFIMNSCESAERNDLTCEKSIQMKKFSEVAALNKCNSDKTLFSLGMSSDVVYKDNQDKMSYGIKILKGVMEMGLKQDVKQVFKSMCTILRHLNENDGHKFYLPVLHIFNQNGNLNKPPRITSDNFFKWESQKLINHSDFNNDTQ